MRINHNRRKFKTMKAFPQIIGEEEYCNPATKIETGLTMRDYFAAKAMQQLIHLCGENDVKSIPLEAYKMADAMMEARNEQ